jgi:hypothetical protein
MKTNKLDNSIKEKFANRTLAPSASAWERLSAKLEEQPKENKIGWFFYIGAAASILLLVSVVVQVLSSDEPTVLPKNEVVIEHIDKDLIDEKLEKLNNELPIEEAIVKTTRVEEKTKVDKEVIPTSKKPKNNSSNTIIANNKKIEKIIANKNKIIIAKIEEKNTNAIPVKEEFQIKLTNKQNPNSRIKIKSEDLLFAVTHTPKEVKEYYAKYNVNREDVLKTIRNQLKESNIKINPNTILTEVERTINDDDFQNNFMKSLRKRVSNIATAIASRND